MENTPRLDLKKPAGIEYVNVADLNENSDKIDAAVGELKDGSAIIPELETVDKTLAGGINENKRKLTTHEAESMPHRTADGNYKYGFKPNANEDGLIFVYEEV
ncbi:hypothetical protein [Sporosarcina sp. P17b]|uniref:hypothetical protein n=1 Tax=Sporosarcina sp. P17b TaxID=2048260 RepID=UPI000C1730E7|nr:hypothetical protein [Sporosarcina sp. P17b]PIC72441.1 hypothetical protein CSV76_15465 [Sporosarcina sp. P17b]